LSLVTQDYIQPINKCFHIIILGTVLKCVPLARIEAVKPFFENLRISATRFQSLLILTHVSIIFSDILTKSYLLARRSTEYSATFLSAKITISVKSLSPQNLRCLMFRPVSCYAFFKEWLLPSLSSGCQKAKTTLNT
jgi:hypothetical protein